MNKVLHLFGEGTIGFDNRDRYTTRYAYDKNGNMLSLKRGITGSVLVITTQDGYFLCYDTLTGNILRLTDSDFVHSYIVAISGSNEDAFQK